MDASFADRCTEVAVTYGFSGSPHIDKQNCGPFYGLALGTFRGGGIRVECSARVVAEVDTRNKIARVDGRYPHWVAPYDGDNDDGDDGDGSGDVVGSAERFSLIYYETGGKFAEPGPAIFSMPSESANNKLGAN